LRKRWVRSELHIDHPLRCGTITIHYHEAEIINKPLVGGQLVAYAGCDAGHGNDLKARLHLRRRRRRTRIRNNREHKSMRCAARYDAARSHRTRCSPLPARRGLAATLLLYAASPLACTSARLHQAPAAPRRTTYRWQLVAALHACQPAFFSPARGWRCVAVSCIKLYVR
jgi:hypothetical protein